MACDVAGEWRQIVDTESNYKEGIPERRFPKVVCAILSTRKPNTGRKKVTSEGSFLIKVRFKVRSCPMERTFTRWTTTLMKSQLVSRN